MDYDHLMQSQARAPDISGERCVIGWPSYDSCLRVEGTEVDLGGWGGRIEKGHRWHDYIADIAAPFRPYFEALRRDIVARKIRRSGWWHQSDPEGVPVLDDGCVVCLSQRAWGDLIAAIWATAEDRDYWYMDFYADDGGPPPD